MADMEAMIEDVRSAKLMLANAEEAEKKAIAETIVARKLCAETIQAFDTAVGVLHKEWQPTYPKGN